MSIAWLWTFRGLRQSLERPVASAAAVAHSIYVHHYKRPPKKMPPAPAIAQAVVTARRTDAKAKAEPLPTEGKKSAIVTSISRKEAEFLRHSRGAEHDVEERDDHTDEAITARYRTLIAKEIEGRLATTKPQANRPLSSRSSGPTRST